MSLPNKYGGYHNLSTPYHPFSSEQNEVPNIEIKKILAKTMNVNISDWSIKLDDALQAYPTASKTPTGCPFTSLYMGNHVI